MKKDNRNSLKEKEYGKNKVLFLKRLSAYILDFIIILLAAVLIAFPFVDSESYLEQFNQDMELKENYEAGKIDMETYYLQQADLSYSMARSNGILSIIVIILEVFYFIVYQIYNNGQTIGKKLFGIRVESETAELTMNQMIVRAFIANFILLYIFTFSVMTFGSKEAYLSLAYCATSIQYLIVFISLFMVIFRKDGCAIHDKIAHTRVVTVK